MNTKLSIYLHARGITSKTVIIKLLVMKINEIALNNF